jgi:hypothetical protein
MATLNSVTATLCGLPSELLVDILDRATREQDANTTMERLRWFGTHLPSSTTTTVGAILRLREVSRAWRNVWSTGMPASTPLHVRPSQFADLQLFGVQHPKRITYSCKTVKVEDMCTGVRRHGAVALDIRAARFGGTLGGRAGDQLRRDVPNLTHLVLEVRSCDESRGSRRNQLQIPPMLMLPLRLVKLCLRVPGLRVDHLFGAEGAATRFPPTLLEIDVIGCKPMSGAIPGTDGTVYLPPSIVALAARFVLPLASTIILSTPVRILNLQLSGESLAIQKALLGFTCGARLDDSRPTYCRIKFQGGVLMAWEMPINTQTLDVTHGVPRTVHPNVHTLSVNVGHNTKYVLGIPNVGARAPLPGVRNLSVTGPPSVARGLANACTNLRYMCADGSLCNPYSFAHPTVQTLVATGAFLWATPFWDLRPQLPLLRHLVVDYWSLEGVAAPNLMLSLPEVGLAAKITEWAECTVLVRPALRNAMGRQHSIAPTPTRIEQIRTVIPHLEVKTGDIELSSSPFLETTPTL